MLTEKTFKLGLKLLEENYDRTLTDAIANIWKQYLDEHLSDGEFLSAVKHLILHSRFMPTAAELVEYIHGSKEAACIQEWGEIIKAAPRSDAKELLVYLSDRAQIALRSIGGLHAIGLADAFDLKRMEKSFLTVYCQCSSADRKSLAQAPAEAPTQAKNEPQEAVPMPEDLREKINGLKAKFAMGNPKGEVVRSSRKFSRDISEGAIA